MIGALRYWPFMFYVSGLALHVGMGVYLIKYNPALLIESADGVSQVANNVYSTVLSMREKFQEILRVFGV